MKRSKWDRQKHKMYSLKRLKSTRKLNVAAKTCAEKDKELSAFKETPFVWTWSKGKGALRARSYPNKLPNYEKA